MLVTFVGNTAFPAFRVTALPQACAGQAMALKRRRVDEMHASNVM